MIKKIKTIGLNSKSCWCVNTLQVSWERWRLTRRPAWRLDCRPTRYLLTSWATSCPVRSTSLTWSASFGCLATTWRTRPSGGIRQDVRTTAVVAGPPALIPLYDDCLWVGRMMMIFYNDQSRGFGKRWNCCGKSTPLLVCIRQVASHDWWFGWYLQLHVLIINFIHRKIR